MRNRDSFAWLAAAIVALLLLAAGIAHAWVAIATGCYVDHVSGVWLALADDLGHGTFYRALVGPTGFGGTRYLPLFFSTIAGLGALGFPPLVAGYVAGLLSASLLAVGLAWLLLELRLSPPFAAIFALLAVAPYFVQQTMLAVRCDVLAVGLATCGMAAVVDARRRVSGWVGPIGLAAAFFTLAAGTKVTAIYAAAVGVAALAIDRAWRQAALLFVAIVAGCAVGFVAIHVLSAGRAMESFTVCAFAGSSPGATLRNALPSQFAAIGGSRILTAVVVMASIAWVMQWRSPSVATAWFPASALVTAIVLGSPGTVAVNHVLDLYIASLVTMAVWIRGHPRAWRGALGVLLALMLLAAWQDARRVSAQRSREVARTLPGERQALAAAIARERVFSEDPTIAVMAGSTPYVLDPFSLRLVLMNRPDASAALLRQVERRAFTRVLLLQDPESRRGRGWYEYTQLGWPLASAILGNYRYQETKAGIRVYVPKP
jgi:hypothetical protein